MIEELKEELKKLKARLDVLEKENIELRTENTKFKDEIKRLSAENTKLKERLNKNSSNSDKPPSTDDFKRRQRNIKKSKRKRGAQPGHKGITRKKVATENITKHIKFHIEDICSCGCKEVVAKQMKPKHQTWELPKIVPNITQYYVESGRCKNCKKRRTAKFPLEVPKGALGPKTQSIISMLTGQYRVSRRNAKKILAELCGLDISVGTVSNSEKIVSNALRNPCMEILKKARASSIINVDETGHFHWAKRCYSWILATPNLTVMKTGLKRNRKALKALLGKNFEGTIISDNYNVYNYLSRDKHQLCWAHLHRKFKAFSEKPGFLGIIGKTLLKLSRRVFYTYKQLKLGYIVYDDYWSLLLQLRNEFRYLFGKYYRKVPDIQSLAYLYWLEGERVWQFAQNPEIEPTNNLAERDLRPSVIWRKTSFGTWSYRGDRFCERMLTFVGTLRKQSRNVLDCLIETVEAKQYGLLAPSVFPD